MGTINFSTAANLNVFNWGVATIATATQIRVIAGTTQTDFSGNFTYAPGSLAGGVLNSMSLTQSGVLQWSATGFSLDFLTGNNFGIDYDNWGAISWMLSGNDNINGSTVNDILNGCGGADIIHGGAGDDILNGGAGNDVLYGDAGNDQLYGGAGNDTLYASVGSDRLVGGSGNDTYVLNSFVATLFEPPNAGTDTILSNYTTDLVNLIYVENVTLTGTLAVNATASTFANILTGNGAANTLSGLGGNDTLCGGAGNDILIGGTGKDTLTGGTGADKFDFNAIAESVVGLNRDVITDFTRAQADKVDLSTIDAKTAAGTANDTFAFIAGTTFTAAGQVRYADGVIYGNTDTDAQAEFEIGIALAGATSMLATDFIL